MDEPHYIGPLGQDEAELGTSWRTYRYTGGVRNVLVTVGAEVYVGLRQVNLQGGNPAAGQRTKLTAGSHSLRVPGSGVGACLPDGGGYIHFAAVDGAVDFSMAAVDVNVAS